MKILPIIPSVYNFDSTSIKDTLNSIILSGNINAVHFDNCDDLSKYKDLFEKYNIIADIHLLGNDPLGELMTIVKMKLNLSLRVSIHIESGQDREKFCRIAKNNNISPGLAFKLKTPIIKNPDFYPDFDYIHIICNDEVSGIPLFQHETLDKIKSLRDFLPKDFSITIDAGVKKENVGPSVQAGVNNIVMGSAIFKSINPLDAVIELNEIVRKNIKNL
jgi:ribulose-phosphate 3-epimerase